MYGRRPLARVVASRPCLPCDLAYVHVRTSIIPRRAHPERDTESSPWQHTRAQPSHFHQRGSAPKPTRQCSCTITLSSGPSPSGRGPEAIPMKLGLRSVSTASPSSPEPALPVSLSRVWELESSSEPVSTRPLFLSMS